MRRRVTFSRNYTLSLSRSCRCYCKYCAFATHKPHLHNPEQVVKQLDRAASRRIKELLVLTGEAPDHNVEVKVTLESWGHASFTDYVVWVCQQALDRGMLPHTNIGVVDRNELAALRTVTASQGLMLESVRDDLVAHQGSPTKDPTIRLECITTAGELNIPFTSGILVGIGEGREDRIAALAKLAEVHGRYGHLQEVIIQNFVPHRSYYGQEPAEIAAEKSEQFWRTGIAERVEVPLPKWACPIGVDDLSELIRAAREMLPGVGVQIPPNLSDWWSTLIDAGATDLGGLSANGDHISPEHPFPSPTAVRGELQTKGIALTERLCVYPQYMNSQWQDAAVLDRIHSNFSTFLPRSERSATTNTDGPELVEQALESYRDGERLTHAELTALFAADRPEHVKAIRELADDARRRLAGDIVTFVVNRNINLSNVCTVGCSFCGFGKSRSSPEAYELTREQFATKVQDALDYGATELCIQSGIHPDWTLEDYEGWLRLAKQIGPKLHLHAYSAMEIDHMCKISDLQPEQVFERLRVAGLDSTPGTAAEILHDGVRSRISPNKLPVDRWVEIIEASHRSGLRSTVTVMFGHIEKATELAEHMRVVRALQDRTGGFTEFVPLSFIPYHTVLGRTHGIEPINMADNLKHTAVFRIALGDSITNLQASWVKMGLDAATEALSWGVNDLGGTLMEESISRMAGSEHGARLDPDDLIAAAHRAGRDAAERTTHYQLLQHYPIG